MTRETDSLLNKIVDEEYIEGIRTRVKTEPGVRDEFRRHKTIKALDDVLAVSTQSIGDVSDLKDRNLPIRIAWITKTPDGFRAVMVGDKYQPETVTGSLETMVKLFKATRPEISSSLLGSDHVFIEEGRSTVNPIVVEDIYGTPAGIAVDGEYTVMDKHDSIYTGYVFNKIIDFAGNTVGSRLWTDGVRFAFQDALAGDEARDDLPTKIASSPSAGIWGTFGSAKDGAVTVFTPFKIKGVIKAPHSEKTTILASTIFGNPIAIVTINGISKAVSATGIKNDELGESLNANIYYVPSTYQFFGLGQERVDLIDDPLHLRSRQLKLFFAAEGGNYGIKNEQKNGKRTNRHGDYPTNNVIVRFDGGQSFGLEGCPIDSFGGHALYNVPFSRSLWLDEAYNMHGCHRSAVVVCLWGNHPRSK